MFVLYPAQVRLLLLPFAVQRLVRCNILLATLA